MTTTETAYAEVPAREQIPGYHKPFWESLKEHERSGAEVRRLRNLRYVPKEICPKCQS